jgi:hypothetical protein
MKRIFTIILVLLALGIYTWDAWLLLPAFGVRLGKREAAAMLSRPPANGLVVRVARVVRFVEKGKSPFVAYKETPKPAKASTAAPTASAPKADAKPPAIIITGLMWNPTNPVAMVKLPDGSSAVAKAGQALSGGIEVKKVEKNGIRVKYEGRDFFIAQ